MEKVREFSLGREIEILVVDRGSRDGSREWLKRQADVRMLTRRQWRQNRHSHGEAAEAGVQAARHDVIVLLDSDAHPVDAGWLEATVDRLDATTRLAGAKFVTPRRDNPHGWYVHPHFMAFFKSDLGRLVRLRKTKGRDTDTGEDSTIHVLAAGHSIAAHPILFASDYSVGHPTFPTLCAGVFHAWYSTRLVKNSREVAHETEAAISQTAYAEPLRNLLRQKYGLSY